MDGTPTSVNGVVESRGSEKIQMPPPAKDLYSSLPVSRMYIDMNELLVPRWYEERQREQMEERLNSPPSSVVNVHLMGFLSRLLLYLPTCCSSVSRSATSDMLQSHLVEKYRFTR